MSRESTRREFITRTAAEACALTLAPAVISSLNRVEAAETGDNRESLIKEALHYEKQKELKIKCVLCPRECVVADMERGYCGVRENKGGKYYTLIHSQPCSLSTQDPIEKKPLFHYLPGTQTVSIATAGCNVECKFCQNWQISQYRPEQVKSNVVTPQGVVDIAHKLSRPTIAYTYSEPVIFYEYMYDTAVVGRSQGIGSVMISNGYIKKEPMQKLCEQLTAVKIDLKAFTEKFYKEQVNGELKHVRETLKLLKEIGIWFEIVVLIIPSLNDKEDEIRQMAKWVLDNLGPDVPMHFSRFHPMYKLRNLPSTPLRTVEMARAVTLDEGIHYAYVGNISPHPGESTYCHKCKKMLIKRLGYVIAENRLKNGKCPDCNETIPGVWKNPLARK